MRLPRNPEEIASLIDDAETSFEQHPSGKSAFQYLNLERRRLPADCYSGGRRSCSEYLRARDW